MKKIYVIDRKDSLKDEIKELFKGEKEFKINRFLPDDFESITKNIPDIIVLNEDGLSEEDNVITILSTIRTDENLSITPIIVISQNNDKKHQIEVYKKDVELFITSPVDEDLLYYRIRNIMRLLNSNRTVSPLTGLPGNVQIQAEINRRLKAGKTFAMLYADLDNFKAYNDTYGFSKGDEIIKYTARTLTKNVLKENDIEDNNFVGHIGGDDFIAIVEGDDYEMICQNIILEFDNGIDKYFTKEDFERGYMEVENRRGIIEEFPITSLSIGVVEVTKERFKNTLEIGEAGASVKHLAKTIFGSTYVIDRRKVREDTYKHV